jgi:hypothetical protein
MIGHAKTATLVCVIQFNIYNNGYWSRNDIISVLIQNISTREKVNASKLLDSHR